MKLRSKEGREKKGILDDIKLDITSAILIYDNIGINKLIFILILQTNKLFQFYYFNLIITYDKIYIKACMYERMYM